MDNQMSKPAANHSNKSHRSVSTWALYSLLIIGLVAEYFAIISAIEAHIPRLPDSIIGRNDIMNLIYVAVVAMLTHQFFIIRNFHILDHSSREELEENSVGDWILKSKLEDFLRFCLFLLFACITGEVAYMILVGSELHIGAFNNVISLFNNKSLKGTKTDDVTWITPFFITMALAMAILMFVWDILAIFKDKPFRKGIKTVWFKLDHESKIVSYPFDKPYLTFLITDTFGLIFWAFIYGIAVKANKEGLIWLILFFILYILVILIRFIGEVRINCPRVIQRFKEYWKDPSFW